MITNLLLNFFAGLVMVALTSSLTLHDTRLDTAFISATTPVSEASSHDFGHALAHDPHIHGSRQLPTNGPEPALANRIQKKHTAAHHTRLKSSLSAV